MKRKLLSMILTASLAATVLAGCGTSNTNKTSESNTSTESSNKKVTLRVAWWGNQTRNDVTKKVMDAYTQKNPNVTFEPEFYDWSGYWDKLATQSAANSMPDIMQMDYSYIGQYVSKKLLANLNSYVSSGKINLKDVNENEIVGGKISGGLYGISLGTNALATIYDPAVLAKAGVTIPTNWTWEDYQNIANKVAQSTGVKTDIALYTDPHMLLSYLAREQGKTMFSKDGTSLGIDSKIVQNSFELQLNLLKSGATPKPDVYLNQTAGNDTLSKGVTGIQFLWSNQLVSAVNNAKKPMQLALMPASKDAKQKPLYLKPSMFFSVSDKSTSKDASAKFIDYFTNDVDANKILLAERGVPISTKVRDAIKSLVSKESQQTFDYIALAEKNTSAIDAPEPTGASEVSALYKSITDEVLYQKTSPKDAADKFVKGANDILAKNK